MIRRRLRSRRMWLTALGIALVFLLFEVGVRFIPPNGMTYVVTDPSGHVVARYSSSTPAVVGGWYTYVNREPSLGFAPPCSAPAVFTPDSGTFTFTWNGIPIESLSGQEVNVCHQYKSSAGGIPDPFDTYFLTNPIDHAAAPPPVGYQTVP